MSEHQLKQERLRMADELVRIKSVFTNEKIESVGRVTFEEFETALHESEVLKEIFSTMGVSMNDVRELYSVLDWDGSGDLTVKEFLEGLRKLQDGGSSAWESLATHAITRKIQGQMFSVQERVERLSEAQESLGSRL